MKNLFYVTACRFHTKEKNTLLFIGYFKENTMENNCPVFMMDQEQLTCVAEEHKLSAAAFREIDGKKITKEYFIWVKLPEKWKEYRQLQVFNCNMEKKELLISISKEKLLKYEKQIPKSVDDAKAGKDGFQIRGWYINEGNTTLRFQDMKGNELPVKLAYENRTDVLCAYPENEGTEILGFIATYTGNPPEKIKLSLEKSDKQVVEVVRLVETPVEKTVRLGKEMHGKFKAYYSQFGAKATIMRIGDKLFQREYSDYEQWLRRHQPSKGVLLRQRNRQFEYMPKISIVVPLYKTPEKYLREMIESVRNQSYANWELCLSDGSGEKSPLIEILKSYEKKDRRIRVVYNNTQLHISDNTNEALKICTGDFIAFTDHDDLLTPNALYECVSAINENPEIEMIYSDEDKINMDGTEYFMPHFKSDFNIDMLRGANYFCHLVVVKRELYEKAGMLNSLYDGSQDYDFVLRCVENTDKIKHIPKILYHWRAHQGSTAANPDSKSYGVEAGRKAIEHHYARVGINATVISTHIPGMYRSKYKLEKNPLVSVIIPNKDHIDDLEKCIRSIEERNSYDNIECIIVENNSQEEKTFEYYKKLEKRNKKIKVVKWEGKGFNYPDINNYGLEYAHGEYLLFLNNDTQIINSDCIEELLGYCMREDVGAVGAKMYYEDGTIQHAGVILGMGGVAGHSFVGLPHDTPGYFGRAILAQDLSAVTAACIMVKRDVYEEVGGFDNAFAVAFNDVDLCMKIRKAGYLIVYNPYAELMHYESKSRGNDDTEEKVKRFVSEIQLFQTRWGDFLEKGDPYYNPNLTLNRHDFSVNMTKK